MTEGEKIYVISEQKIECPNCRGEADVIVTEYRSPQEILVLVTLKCSSCGYRKNDIIPILEEDTSRCIEIEITSPEDLNTIIYIPPGSSIEIPEVSIEIDMAELSDMLIGNYVTVDGVIMDVIEYLEHLCVLQEDAVGRCTMTVETLRQAVRNTPTRLTLRVTNDYGNIRVVKTYRNNYIYC